MILAFVSTESAASFEEIYSPLAESIGRRGRHRPIGRFRLLHRNNSAWHSSASPAASSRGLGTLFFLAYNGVFSDALAGYLAERGLAPTFFLVVATHSAFELTAIVLSGAAGCASAMRCSRRGAMTRKDAARRSRRGTATLLYGVTVMLVGARCRVRRSGRRRAGFPRR